MGALKGSAVIRRSLFLLVVSVATPSLAEVLGVPLKDSVPHMFTTGEASVDVMPDQADLDFDVSQERKTVGEAADAAAKAAQAVIETLEARGVEPGDIHTSLGLAQTFDMKDERDHVVANSPRGYAANEHIAVHLRDIAKVGAIARDLIAKGVKPFLSLSFSYSKETQRRRDLGAEAMRDALQQAKVYTDAIGLKLGPVLEIGQDPISARQTFRLSGGTTSGGASEGVAIPIEPGLLRLREAVTVIWQIEGRAH